jgi:multiple sugar transport system permease protein
MRAVRLKIRANAHYLMALPALAVMVAVLIRPLVELVRYSMVAWSFGWGADTMRFVGLDNYKVLLTPGSAFLKSVRTTMVFVAASVILQTVIGLACASIFNSRIPGQTALISILIIPTILMPVMTAMMWRIYFYPNGIVNYLLSFFGLAADWYGSRLALPAVVFVQVWQWTPFYIVSLIAGLRSISGTLYEAANVDGATRWQKYRLITLPLLKPVLGVCITIRAMNLIRDFDTIYVIYGGGPGSATEVLGLFIYRTMFLAHQVGMAAAASLLLALISLIVSLALIRVFMRANSI